MSDYRFYLLGAPRLEHNGKLIEVDTRKALALLAYIIIEDQPQSRDTLAALLWPESNQSSARAALRRTLSTLRKALTEELIDFGREIIALEPGGGLWCDVRVFQKNLQECRQHGHEVELVCPRCQPLLEKAADLYTDDFMAGFSLRDSAKFDDWQFFQADRLRAQLSSILERLIILNEGHQDYSTAIDNARRWLTLDFLNEAAHRRLIRLYALNDQRNAALRQYRECVRILDEELGVPPLAETTEVYNAAKENRLDEFKVDQPVSLDTPTSTGQAVFTSQSAVTERPIPLVGRAGEIDHLTSLYDKVLTRGAFAVLTGEAGIGKTRLAQEFVNQLQSRGAVILSARCYAGESNLAYTPLIDLLRQGIERAGTNPWWKQLNRRLLSEVSLIVPELADIVPDLPPPQQTDAPAAQARFYESVIQVLEALVSGSSPGVLFIDNLEWADDSSMDLLAYLARRLPRRSIFLLICWRTETTAQPIILEQVLTEAVHQGYGLHLPLSPLKPDQIIEIIDRAVVEEHRFHPSFKTQLVEESQGVPYFLVEYLQAARGGKIDTQQEAENWPVPAGLRGMLQNRLANLSGTASQVLQAAAVIGRTFDSALLRSASGRTEEEIVYGVEELLRYSLIQEISAPTSVGLPTGAYDFKHDQMRDLVLEEISLVRSQLLHRRTAEVLEEHSRTQTSKPQFGQIAYHYQQAGIPEKAAEYFYRAGQLDRSIHANADALAHFETALALGYPARADALFQMGDLFTLKGDYHQALQQYEAAASYLEPGLLPVVDHRIGQVYLRRGQWEQAASHFEAAMVELGDANNDRPEAFEAEIRCDWSMARFRIGDREQASSLAEEALALAETSKDPLALAQVHNLLGVLARSTSQPEEALKNLEKSLIFARKLNNPGAQIAALNNLALAQASLDEYKSAIETIRQAIDECTILGDRHLEAALRNNHADILRASGDHETAMVELKRAVAIFADIDQIAGDREPEIWKLTDW